MALNSNTNDKAVSATSPMRTYKVVRRRRMTLAWSVWFVAALFVFFQFYLQLSSGEIVDGLMKTFSLTAVGGGVLASAYYYIYAVLQVPAGLLMDRYGARVLLSSGAVVVGVACILFGSTSSLTVAIVARILMGGGAAFAFVGCLHLVAKWFPSRRFAMMVALVECAGMFGTIVGELFLAGFIHRVGWQMCMAVSGVFAFVIAVLLWFVIRNAPRKKQPQVSVSLDILWQGLKLLVRNPLVWINGVYVGLIFSVLTVFSALWAIPFFEQAHHVSLVNATLVAVFLYAGVAVGGPILGWLDGRTCWRKKMLFISALISAILLFIVIFDTKLSMVSVAALLFVTGFFSSAYVLSFAVASQIAGPANRATCIGFTNMLCVIFAPIFQPLIGYILYRLDLHDRTAIIHHVTAHVWHFEVSLSVVPVGLLVASVLALFLPNRQRSMIKRAM